MVYSTVGVVIRCIGLAIFALSFLISSTAISQVHDGTAILIPSNAEWRYQASVDEPELSWYKPGFDDIHWKSGKAGFGYGDDDDRTRFFSMRGKFNSVRIRQRFEINSPDEINNLFLYVRYDDAFIAYLNGIEVVRSGIGQNISSRAVKQHEAEDFEEFSIADPSRILNEGTNLLAIEGFNHSVNSSDFSLHPVLTTQHTDNPGLPVTLSRQEMLSDIDELEWRLENQSSYILLQKFDYKKALIRLRENIGEDSSLLLFARNLQKIIVQIGDTHAEVKLSLDEGNERYLPFVLADSSDGIIAINVDQKTLLSVEHPLVQLIDGEPIQYWMDLASRYVAQGSPQFIRRESLLELRSIDRIRDEGRVATIDFVDVTLRSPDGAKQTKLRLATSKEKMPASKLILADTQILGDNIGYLRISSMNKSRVDELVSDMTRLRDTNGLIIDVRDNRGGYYELLWALYGYFIGENEMPYVSNVAAYRQSKQFEYDHLHYRHTYRLEHLGWTAAERTVIKQAVSNFKPQWQLPDDQFSDWHFMVLGKSGDRRQYHYRKPVAVLSNASSYSATDGFLSAFSDLPGVVLIGQPSSGASGATQQFTLPNSGIEITLSSMASFRPNGKLFDGNGVEVDISVKATPEDFLGHSDSVLGRAIQWVTETRE